VSGTIDAVFWGKEAGWLIAGIADGYETGHVLLRMDDPGVNIRLRESADLTYPVCRVVLASCPVERLPAADPSWARLRGLLACAELEGAARSCLTLAVDYMKARKQFGQEIGRFQALKHIAATDALYIENMQVANEYAAWAHDARADDAEMALHIAKQYASDSARVVAQDSIQCHGGIGFTWVYGLHFYLRRIIRLGAMFGTAMQHREELLSLLIAEQDANHNIKETS
jgi:alkylation response protein AidB-like acyl-CoA dehydrogenase